MMNELLIQVGVHQDGNGGSQQHQRQQIARYHRGAAIHSQGVCQPDQLECEQRVGNPQVHHRPVHEAGQGKISHLEGLKINCLILILLEISYLLVKKE